MHVLCRNQRHAGIQKAILTIINVKNTLQIFFQFLIVLVLATLIVTLYFVYSFGNLADSVSLKAVLMTIKQFSLVISIPTSILFVLIDLLVKNIRSKWILYFMRGMVFFSLLILFSLFFSFYLISNALLDNPFMK